MDSELQTIIESFLRVTNLYTKRETIEILSYVKKYCNEPGINKEDISGLLTKIIEEL